MSKRTGTPMTLVTKPANRRVYKAKEEFSRWCCKCRRYLKKGERYRYTRRDLVEHVQCPDPES